MKIKILVQKLTGLNFHAFRNTCWCTALTSQNRCSAMSASSVS